MTVRELKEYLSFCNPDAKVEVQIGNHSAETTEVVHCSRVNGTLKHGDFDMSGQLQEKHVIVKLGNRWMPLKD